MQTTITEALAELKMIDKRIQKKREFVLSYLMRQEVLKDPHEKDGGSVSAIKRELQAVRDLEERAIRIRRAINEANLATKVSVSETTRTIADWIIWRREIAPKLSEFLNGMNGRIAATRQEAMKKGMAVVAASPESKPTDVVVNVNEQDLARWREDLDATLETLDGLLSLKNATTTIAV